MSNNAERAAQLVPDSIPAYYRGPTTAAIAAALDEAEARGYERGREELAKYLLAVYDAARRGVRHNEGTTT